jgi:hypothetical protein
MSELKLKLKESEAKRQSLEGQIAAGWEVGSESDSGSEEDSGVFILLNM